MKLTDVQTQAVEYIGSPTLVVAGAGSGKTRTLTSKIAYLIEKGYTPERILAITFTNKAADEMKSRLLLLTGFTANRFPWVRTYHSACFQLLKRHCTRIGYQNPIQVFASYQQEKVIKDIVVNKLQFDKKFVPSVLNQISNAKNSANPEGYFTAIPTVGAIRLGEVYQLYEQALKNQNAVDFDNILLLARNLLRDFPDIREKYQTYFQYILCDEYQDTNDLNEEITRLLVNNGNLFVVGDDWQSIYSFRMSNVRHFLSFEKTYPNAKIFHLEQNFRSANHIVTIANQLISNNRHKMDKNCFSTIDGGTIQLKEFYSDKDEASWVTRQVNKFILDGIPPGKIAILFRTRFCSLAFEQCLRSMNIRYRMQGGQSFFERREILDLHGYLSASVFPKDDISFERILNIPRRGIGQKMIEKLYTNRNTGESLQEATRRAVHQKMLSPKITQEIHGVLQLLDQIRTLQPNIAIETVINAVNFMDHVKTYAKNDEMDFISRQENIDQLIYAASEKNSIEEYMEDAVLIREDKADDEEKQKQKGVILSTIHAAKGLEYTVVFVVACEENLFPHWKTLDTEESLEEERRLMYVSMTRSERHLFLTSAQIRKGQYDQYRSRFLDEIETAIKATQPKTKTKKKARA
ncbi:MAG: UvrD-helicase domain-containing protein [Desulfobacterales bacterium]|nr:UvrD-helicase domain-containing protein [Desulfobacterales bacterium]